MRILPINNFYAKNVSTNSNALVHEQYNSQAIETLPAYNQIFNARNVSRRVLDIDNESFVKLSDTMKKLYRMKCKDFAKIIDFEKLENPNKRYLPLMQDYDMESFLTCCIDKFNMLKGSPIICLGRSPKWFLNTSYWMKDGIEDYKFVAFSGSWYRQGLWGLVKENSKMPTKEEQNAYKNYLKSIQADPASIVKTAKETGKKVVITDYIRTGKGLKSYLEVMSNIAEEQGVLEDFAKSIRFHLFSCQEYLDDLYGEKAPTPSLNLPEKLAPYREEIPSYWVNIPLDITLQILENKNTNECRATYYPPKAWGIYLPNNYRTGMIPNSLMDKLKEHSPKSAVNFTTQMRDYRNLLNFRILDYLEQKDLLR